MSNNPNEVYLPIITVTPDGTEDKGPFEKAVDSYVDGATEFDVDPNSYDEHGSVYMADGLRLRE